MAAGTTAKSVADFRNIWRGFEIVANPPAVEVGTTPCDVVYREDKMRLLHYRSAAGHPRKPPLLLVYAVINKPYILDLQPDRSVVRALQKGGIDVYMIDWGIPSSFDRNLGLEDYIQGYLDRAVNHILEHEDIGQVSLMGYCIGGFLATIYGALYPAKVRNLILMASPLDFGVQGGLLHLWTKPEYFDPELVVEAYGNVPAEFLNGGFVMLDPLGNTYLKYLGLFDRAEDEEFVEMFFRMEKWIGDGVPVAGEFYKEFIRSGYQRNLLVQNKLVVGERHVNLNALEMPILIVVAEKDHIVPADSTRNLARLVPSRDVDTFSLPVGHIGLSVGSEAHQDLWPKVAEWIAKRSLPVPKPTGGKPSKRRTR